MRITLYGFAGQCFWPCFIVQETCQCCSFRNTVNLQNRSGGNRLLWQPHDTSAINQKLRDDVPSYVFAATNDDNGRLITCKFHQVQIRRTTSTQFSIRNHPKFNYKSIMKRDKWPRGSNPVGWLEPAFTSTLAGQAVRWHISISASHHQIIDQVSFIRIELLGNFKPSDIDIIFSINMKMLNHLLFTEAMSNLSSSMDKVSNSWIQATHSKDFHAK